MLIAVASQNFRTVTGHAGKARRFMVFEAETGQTPREVSRLDLPREQSMHEFTGGAHPLDDVQVLIAGSAGAGFINRMSQRGVLAVATSETDPITAVADYLKGTLAAPALTTTTMTTIMKPGRTTAVAAALHKYGVMDGAVRLELRHLPESHGPCGRRFPTSAHRAHGNDVAGGLQARGDGQAHFHVFLEEVRQQPAIEKRSQRAHHLRFRSIAPPAGPAGLHIADEVVELLQYIKVLDAMFGQQGAIAGALQRLFSLEVGKRARTDADQTRRDVGDRGHAAQVGNAIVDHDKQFSVVVIDRTMIDAILVLPGNDHPAPQPQQP